MGRILRKMVFLFDSFLRWVYREEEFSKDRRCIFRISLKRSKIDLSLSDGTTIKKGDPIVELHYWNEHMLPIPPEGPDVSWGIKMYKQLLFTLVELDRFISEDPRFMNVKAFTGRTTLMSHNAEDGLLKRLGFEFIQSSWPLKGGPFMRNIRSFGALLENCYWWVLVWAFNPGSLKGKRFKDLLRCDVWISRRKIEEFTRGLSGEKVFAGL